MIETTQDEVMRKWNKNMSLDTPLVSVRCITYNHENYIAQALDSFIMQKTNFPFEIIVHDDASTDRTAEIIREYEKKYPLIVKPIYEEENQWSKPGNPLGKIVNAALNGKYVAICEGDDYWIDENKLQMQVDFLENNPEYGMCYTNFNIYYQNKKKFEFDLFTTHSEKFLKQYDSLEQWILKKGYIAPMTWVYRKSLLDSYDSMNSCDGTYVLVAHFMANSKIKCLDKTTATYRVLEESASHSNNLEKLYNRHRNLKEVQYKLIEKYNLDKALKKNIDENYCREGIKLFVALDKKDDLKLCDDVQLNSMSKLVLFFSKLTIFRFFLKFLYFLKGKI